MRSFHDAPIFKITDRDLLVRFCARYHIDFAASVKDRITSIATAFSQIPYENLTKIIKADSVVGAASAMRYPDELIADHLRWGTGGTCFSLTAAIVALYDALGIEAHPLLADRHYGVDTHCGLVVIDGSDWLLLDPGYLLFTPVPLPVHLAAAVPQGYTTIELTPLDMGRKIELATSVKGNRKVRLVYKRAIVDPETFAKAWEASFTWEMMTYPVATRCVAGEHVYMQGTALSVRSTEKTRRRKIDIGESVELLRANMGISPDIAAKAWGIVHGAT